MPTRAAGETGGGRCPSLISRHRTVASTCFGWRNWLLVLISHMIRLLTLKVASVCRWPNSASSSSSRAAASTDGSDEYSSKRSSRRAQRESAMSRKFSLRTSGTDSFTKRLSSLREVRV